MFKRAGSKSSNVKEYQFWQHHNKPIELWSAPVIEQKADYFHENPVVAGFVNEDGIGNIVVRLTIVMEKDLLI